MGVGCYPLDAWDEEKQTFKKGLPEFGRNWFHWRPLWDFVYENCKDLITEDQYAAGHSNCGDLFDKETCRKVAKRIKGLKCNKNFPEVISPINNESPPGAITTWYRFDDKDIKEFARFLSKANGMAIY